MADSKHRQVFDQIKTDLLTTAIASASFNSNAKAMRFPFAFIEVGGGEPENISFGSEDQNYPMAIHILHTNQNVILNVIEELRSLWRVGTAKREVLRLLGVIDIAVADVEAPQIGSTKEILSGLVEYKLLIRYYP